MDLEAWANIIKVFVEKHLKATVIAFAIACFAYVKLPADNEFIARLGDWFIPACTAVSFVVVQVISMLFRWGAASVRRQRSKKDLKQIQDEELHDSMEHLWSFVDLLSPEDRDNLRVFLATCNKPIRNGERYPNGLFRSDYVHSRVVPIEELDFTTENVTMMDGTVKQMVLRPVESSVKEYRLTDSFYRTLKYSHDNYGRISHFE